MPKLTDLQHKCSHSIISLNNLKQYIWENKPTHIMFLLFREFSIEVDCDVLAL